MTLTELYPRVTVTRELIQNDGKCSTSMCVFSWWRKARKMGVKANSPLQPELTVQHELGCIQEDYDTHIIPKG